MADGMPCEWLGQYFDPTVVFWIVPRDTRGFAKLALTSTAMGFGSSVRFADVRGIGDRNPGMAEGLGYWFIAAPVNPDTRPLYAPSSVLRAQARA